MTESSKPTASIRGMDCHVNSWNVAPEKKQAKALMVIFHGFLAHGNYPTVRYAAEFLAQEDYAVVSVDFPGHGKSPGTRGLIESAETLVEDGAAMVEYATGLYKNQSTPPKLFLVGSSMGGAIALSVAHKLPKEAVTGVLLLAPMLKLNVSSIEHYALKGLAFVMPTVPLIPSSATNSEKQYRDETKRQECDKDELTVSGAKLRIASALSCVETALNIRSTFDSVTTPFLIMVADEDVVVKNEGSEELYQESPSKDKTKNHYPALHGLLCEPSPLFDEIKKDMLDWIKGRL
jgi:acylglycerol lipase